MVVVAVSLGAAAATAAGADGQRHGPPEQLQGLTVQKEDVSKVIATDKKPVYFDRVALYSLREQGQLLQATLEMAHFKKGSPWNAADFQLSVVTGIGSTIPIVDKVGHQRVYVTSSKGLVLAIWFVNQDMMMLSIRRTYKQPKDLLRQAVSIQP